MILDNGWLFLCWEPTVHSQKIPGAGYLPACCLHTLSPSLLAFPVSTKASTQDQEIIMLTAGDVLDHCIRVENKLRLTHSEMTRGWPKSHRNEKAARVGNSLLLFVPISSLGLVKPWTRNLNSLSFCSESFVSGVKASELKLEFNGLWLTS